MRRVVHSHFLSAVVGGLVVGVGLVAINGGIGAGRTTTIVEEAPLASAPLQGAGGLALTAHDIYARYAPAVVFVRAKLVAPVQSPFDMFHVGENDASTGSGFLVDRHGDVLTDYHIVDGADRSAGVMVDFEDNIVRPASVVAIDPASDLAVLHVDMRGVPATRPLQLGDSTSVRVGDPTLTIGNPFGVDRTLTSGIVSALQHQIQASDGRSIDNVIQIDQPIDAAASGGPLLNAGGYVVGISSQVAAVGSGTRPGEALAFAIPIDTADAILARAAHAGPVRLAYLGLVAAPARSARTGVRVTSVAFGGPAAQGGVQRGDVIERIDEDPVASFSDVLALVSTRSPGQALELAVRREGRTRDLSVVLGSRTAPAPSRP